MSIREIMEDFPYEELRKDNRNFCTECGRITESTKDEKNCSICGSNREKETLLEKVMEKEGMNEFGKAYPNNPQIIELLSDRWDEFLDINDAVTQVCQTFGVSEEDAMNVVDAVEGELGTIVAVGDDDAPYESRVVKKKQKNEDVEGEPTENDITTEDDENWYQYGDLFHTGDRQSLKAELDKGNFFPDIWTISDHGNSCNISKSVYNESDEGNFETLGSGLSKEDAEKLSREKQGTVVADEGEDDKYSVIKKEEVR